MCLNVCIYLRKSRADREAEARGEGETLARHERILLDLAKSRGYNVGAVYKEIVSGETISARPVMQQVLREVEDGMWDGVLVVEVERLARGDTIDQGTVSRAFQYSDTLIITPVKDYNPNDEFDEEYFEFGLFMSRREYKTIKRRLNAGRMSSVKEGKYCGNIPPYGYKRVKLENDKGFTLEPVPDQAEIVRLVFNWYVNGIDGERIGTSKIARRLNDMKVPSRKGKDWTPASVRSILENPVYCGKLWWNHRKGVRRIEDGQVVISRPKAKEYILSDGLHTPIISEELYNTAFELRHNNPPLPAPSTYPIKNPLSGLVFCKKCGRSMMRRPYAKRGQDDTLLCPYPSCDTVSSKLCLVEKVLIDSLAEMVKDYKLNNTLQIEGNSDAIASKEAILKEQASAMQRLQEQKNRQFDLLEQGVYTVETFLERSNALDAQLKEHNSSIQKLKDELDHDRKLLDQRERFIPKCEYLLQNYWSWDVQTKNTVLKELIERVEYSKDSKNRFREGDKITFTLDIFPRIQ